MALGELRQREPRVRDERHLRLVRQCPCLICHRAPCGEAAHVRYASDEYGKREPGIGAKPSDRWTVPLCHEHHMAQHSVGEKPWWRQHGIDPLRVATMLSIASPDLDAMVRIVGMMGK